MLPAGIAMLAAGIIVPLVMQAQRANGIEIYGPEDYEKLPYVKQRRE